MALFELFGWLKYFRQKRQQENLTRAELLKRELVMIAFAILGILILFGFLFVLYWISGR